VIARDRLRTAFPALQSPVYRRYLLAGVFATIGAFMGQTAQGWLVLVLTNSPALLGLAATATGLPTLFLALFAGVLADRMDRRRLLVITNLTGALVAFTLALLTTLHVIEYWHVLVLAFLAGLGAAWLLTRFPARRAWHPVVAVFLLAVAIGVPWAQRSRALDQRGNVFAETLGRGILVSLPPRAVLFVQGDLLHNALAYLTLVEHERPDVVVLDQELMTYPWYVRRVRAAHPDVLPPLGRGEQVTLADGRVVDGIAIPRKDGTVDLLSEHGQVTLSARDVAEVAAVAAETLFAATRAGFRSSALLQMSEDRYSGLPGTRNLLWLDHLAGKRSVAFLGVKDESYSLRYELAPAGFVMLAHPHGEAPAPAAEAAHALAVLEQVPLEPWFRAYDPTSFEVAERWRFAAFAARTMLLCCRPEAEGAIRANSRGHEQLLAFARRFEPLEPTPDPACLRAVAFLRVFDPAFRDLGAARRDFERYRVTGAAAARDAEVRGMLERLPADATR